MLEVAPVEATLIHCLAAPEALEHLRVTAPAVIGPLAPGETLIVAPPQDTATAAEADRALAADPDRLVIDLTDAYDGFRLAGDYRAAFARCADWPLPDTGRLLLQGLFAQLAAKVVQSDTELYVFVGSHVGHHLDQRLRHACADLDVVFRPPVDFSHPGAAS